MRGSINGLAKSEGMVEFEVRFKRQQDNGSSQWVISCPPKRLRLTSGRGCGQHKRGCKGFLGPRGGKRNTKSLRVQEETRVEEPSALQTKVRRDSELKKENSEHLQAERRTGGGEKREKSWSGSGHKTGKATMVGSKQTLDCPPHSRKHTPTTGDNVRSRGDASPASPASAGPT